MPERRGVTPGIGRSMPRPEALCGRLFWRCAVIAVASLALAPLAARDAALAYWRTQDPHRVPAFLSGDPAIAVARADRELSGPGLLTPGAADAREAAKAALRREPLQTGALRLLARTLLGSGEGMELLLLAERVSRRDLQLELQLIDATAATGDVVRVIAHYDHVLAAHPEAASRLLPVLARAASDDGVGAALARHAARAWYPGLIAAAIDEGTEPDALARLLALGRRHWPAETVDRLVSRQLDRLVATGRLDAARRLAGQVPGTAAAGLGSIGFGAATTDPRLRPLSWKLAEADGALAEPGEGGGLAIRVDAERTALVAERVTLLAGGSYAVTQTLSYAAGAPMARLAWRVDCVSGGPAAVWQQVVPVRAGRVTYRSRITVPAGCPAQRWRLMATAPVAPTASQVWLERLELAAR